jgi:HTH-type transcriptional regulator / antitoxin HigA
MQPIKPIRNEADYELALKDIDACLDAGASSPERDRLEVLTVLVDDYEAKHYPISAPDPIAAIEFVLEQQGLTRKDLEEVIGSSGRISEVMNKQRPLTLAMIRKLVEKFDLPADVLIRSTGDSRALGNVTRAIAWGRPFVVTRAKRVKACVGV